MSETTGNHALPDLDLTLDLFDLVGRLRRSANTSSRFGQTSELQGIADQIVRWQAQLRKAVVLALGHGDMTVAWNTLVNQIAELRRECDTAQTLHRMAAEDLRDYDRTFTRQREELDRLRKERSGE